MDELYRVKYYSGTSLLVLHYSKILSNTKYGLLRGLTSSALDHRSLLTEFESQRRPIWRVFHLWHRFITFGCRSAHLAYRMHKSGHETSTNTKYTITSEFYIYLYPLPNLDLMIRIVYMRVNFSQMQTQLETSIYTGGLCLFACL